MPMLSRIFFAGCLLLSGTGVPCAASPPLIQPEARWVEGPSFMFTSKPDKHRRSISGIACLPLQTDGQRCIVVFDEGVEVRTAVILGEHLVPDTERIVLLPGGKELDAEAAARDGSFVFVTGSHSAKRGDCENNPDARHVFRFQIEADGKPRTRSQDNVPADLASDGGRLWNVLRQHPALRDFVGDNKCLGSKPPKDTPNLKGLHGVNIEAMAAAEGQLFFGFREPALDGHVPVLRVAAAALFAGGPLAEHLFTVFAGPARGLRDMVAVPGGLLLLLGPDDDSRKDVGWSLAFWDKSEPASGLVQPKSLADLAVPAIRANQCDDENKPEAMALLEDGLDFWRVLMLSDGMCDGGPMVFRIAK